MSENERNRLALLARFEQIAEGLANGDESTAIMARSILAGIIARGSCELLAQVFREIVLAWDDEAMQTMGE